MLTGVMNLFCQVLKEPTNPQTENDISLLDQISQEFSLAAESHASPEFSGDICSIRDFVAELSRLARCAILKGREIMAR
jgi:hypothetical protein